MNSQIITIISIAAIIISPIIAIYIGELLRKRNFKKEKRLAILNDLVAYRHKLESDQFISALNLIKLFYKDKYLNSIIFEFRNKIIARDQGQGYETSINVLIVKLIKRLCELEKFDYITEEDINNLFKRK